MTPAIDPEFQALIPALSADEFARLEENILTEGCRDALVTWNGVLIDGHNRFAICQRHNVTFDVITRDFDSRNDVIAWMCANQLARRNISQVARDQLALRMKKALLSKGKENMSQGLSETDKPQDTRDEVAGLAGTSRTGIAQSETILDHAPPALKEQALNGDVSRDRAYQLTRRFLELPAEDRDAAAQLCDDSTEKADALVRLYKSSGSPETNGTYGEIMATGGFHYGDDMELYCMFHERTAREIDIALRSVAKYHIRLNAEVQRAARTEAAQSLPPEVYNVVYADPAWEYNNTGLNGAAENHYGTMPIDAIYTLPTELGLCVADNAVLFLWVTNPLLIEGLECIRRWGFVYKTQIVWVKKELEKPGVGWYVRGRHELLLIATRGRFTPVNEHISPPIGSVLEAPIREHSRKPEQAYEIIERLYPDCNYIELFARHAREGWSAWGNELDG